MSKSSVFGDGMIPMTKVQYFRLAVFFPIIMPVPGLILLSSLELLGIQVPDWFGEGFSLAFSAAFMFGLPYIIIIGILLFLLRHGSWKMHAIAAVSAPLILSVCLPTIFLLEGMESSRLWEMSLFYAKYCFVVGYSYVGLAFFVMWVLGRAGIVRENLVNISQ